MSVRTVADARSEPAPQRSGSRHLPSPFFGAGTASSIMGGGEAFWLFLLQPPAVYTLHRTQNVVGTH